MSVTLKGITWDHPRGYEPLMACSAVYEKQSAVKIEWHKRSLTAFGDQSLEELCNNFDLLIIDHPHVGLAENKGLLEPLENMIPTEKLECINTQSAGPSFLSYNYLNKQWALPIDAAMQAAAYRPDLLAEEQLPGTWKHVFELAENLRKYGRYMGTALSPTDCLCSFLTLAAQANAPVREDNSELIGREPGLNVLDKLKRLKDISHPECLQWTPVNLFDYMSSNDDVLFSPLAFCYNNYSRNNFRKKKLAFHCVPERTNAVLGGAGIAISSSCKNKSIAGEFISWICSAEIQQTIYTDAQGQPGNILAWTAEKPNKITSNFFFNTLSTLENAYVRPRYNGWAEFQSTLGNIVHKFLEYGEDSNTVLDALNILFQQSKPNT